MSDEGERAIEAAGKRLAEVQGAEPYSASPEAFQNDARETIRAYLDALPGHAVTPRNFMGNHKMVTAAADADSIREREASHEELWQAAWDAAPSPPGLENSDD